MPQHAVSAAGISLADVTPDDEVGVFKQRWAGLFFLSGLQGGSDPGGTSGPGRGQAASCAAASPPTSARSTSRRRSPATRRRVCSTCSTAPRWSGCCREITAPTLIVQGEDDTLFTLDQADANFRGLPATTPAAMAWVEGGHDGGIDLESLLPQLAGLVRPLPAATTRPRRRRRPSARPCPTTALVGRDQDRGEPTTVTAADYPGRTSGTVEQATQPSAGTRSRSCRRRVAYPRR